MSTELRRQIRESTCDRESLGHLQTVLPQDDAELDALIGELLAENAVIEFASVVYAALGANRSVDAKHLVKGAGVFTEAETLADIAMRLQGNVAHYLFEALDKQPFEPRDKVLILLVIAVWSRERRHADFPPELFPRTRELLRMRNPDKNVIGILISIALYTKDEGLLELLRKQHYPTTSEKNWQTARDRALDLVKYLSNLGKNSLFDNLPERRDRMVAYGDTMRRSVAQVGRNEPCPCGSGKKYKQCCLEKDRERLRHSTDIAGVTQEEMEAAPERGLTPARMDEADIYTVQTYDPLKLSPAILERYFPRLTEYRLFDRLAESFEKVGYSDNLLTAWNEAVRSAAMSGRKDIAQRLINVRKPYGFSEDQLPIVPYFLMIEDDPEKCLAFIEDTVRAALESEDLTRSASATARSLNKPLSDLAHAASISKFPGLGIVLARSAAPLASPADASRLMEHLLRARDHLNLAPDDAISEVLDTLWARAGEDADASEAYRDVLEKFEAKRRESRELREELERRKKEVRRLATAHTQTAAPPAAVIQADRDKSRHERKIGHLEKELKASHEEENSLRRQVQHMQLENEELKQKAADNVKTTADSEIDREEELLLQAETQGTQPVRIIDFSRDFQQRLNNAPRHIARSAMAMLGRLASGEPAAFVGAVRLKACPTVMRHRIGIDWRLLFRLLPDRVDAVDLIPRQDLERRIKTLVTQYA